MYFMIVKIATRIHFNDNKYAFESIADIESFMTKLVKIFFVIEK